MAKGKCRVVVDTDPVCAPFSFFLFLVENGLCGVSLWDLDVWGRWRWAVMWRGRFSCTRYYWRGDGLAGVGEGGKKA